MQGPELLQILLPKEGLRTKAKGQQDPLASGLPENAMCSWSRLASQIFSKLLFPHLPKGVPLKRHPPLSADLNEVRFACRG